ncbi:TetR/AcrR family transcriptional regulator [Ruania zhangjianzhongii]|uniref:TetR/AcrR family transcriptional regulator n=1 Tax=Ruania zhangjianzhongii TaxID=2603206 RepID=UPI0011CBD078|nr:TetR/AcrR family transcriptional regulator [Ruania zhangjianzhongii]
MTPTPRELARERTEAEILRLAREQLATSGPAELSLRAIARELGIVSSAIYRYVRNRDELLTLLVIDGYNDLGDAVDQATSAVDDEDHLGRFLALGRAVRTWALAESARYALLYGTPVPGYDAPGERTIEPGTRVIVSLARIADDAWAAGALGSEGPAIPETVVGDFEQIREEFGLAAPAGVLARVMLIWPALFGCVTFETFGQYGTDTFTDNAVLFELQLRQLADLLGLTG